MHCQCKYAYLRFSPACSPGGSTLCPWPEHALEPPLTTLRGDTCSRNVRADGTSLSPFPRHASRCNRLSVSMSPSRRATITARTRRAERLRALAQPLHQGSLHLARCQMVVARRRWACVSRRSLSSLRPADQSPTARFGPMLALFLSESPCSWGQPFNGAQAALPVLVGSWAGLRGMDRLGQTC